MPTYIFNNTETGEAWEEFMTNSAREELLATNPHIQQIPTAPAFISGVGGVTHKNDSGFGDLMSRIAAANPYSPLADTYGDKSVKASKTRDVVKKAKSKL